MCEWGGGEDTSFIQQKTKKKADVGKWGIEKDEARARDNNHAVSLNFLTVETSTPSYE